MMFKRNILRLVRDTKINTMQPKEDPAFKYFFKTQKTKLQLICHISKLKQIKMIFCFVLKWNLLSSNIVT